MVLSAPCKGSDVRSYISAEHWRRILAMSSLAVVLVARRHRLGECLAADLNLLIG